MKTSEVIQAWKSVLSGRRPSLAIEITRECPLHCPGCYAFEDGHVGGLNLRQLQDKRGEDLVQGVLALVDEHRPLHLSLVGGDPLVRYREVTRLLPLLEDRGIYVQVVTSAFRQIPPEWASIERLNIVVSIDGLQPEHDVAPQTGHLRPHSRKHSRTSGDRALHHYRPDDETASHTLRTLLNSGAPNRKSARYG